MMAPSRERVRDGKLQGRGQAPASLLRRAEETSASLESGHARRDGVRHVAMALLSARLGLESLQFMDSELRRRDHSVDDSRAHPLLAVDPQIDCGHEEDAGNPAEDEGDSEEVQGQSATTSTGDMGALSRGKGESDELVSADADSDSRLHRALQRPAFGGRASLCAVPLDCRPLGARRAVRGVFAVWRPQHPADPDGAG